MANTCFRRKISRLSPSISYFSKLFLRPISFTDLEIDLKVTRALRKNGIRQPTDIQIQAYKSLMSGESAVLNSSTGSGKTLAYALPIVQGIINLKKNKEKLPRPYALIIVPNIELSYQVCNTFRSLLSVNVCVASEQLPLKLKEADVVVTTATYVSTYPLDVLNETRTVVIDEADMLIAKKVGKHGNRDPLFVLIFHLLKEENFYLIPGLTSRKRQFVFVGATMPDSLNKKSKKALPYIRKWVPDLKLLQGENTHKFVSSLDMEFVHVLEGNKIKHLLDSIQTFYNTNSLQTFRVLIFVNKVHTVSSLHQTLSSATVKDIETEPDNNQFPDVLMAFQREWKDCIFALHKNISVEERLSTLHYFSALPKALLVTTDVSARGLDFPDVDLVIQYDFSTNIVDVLHRAGRTARMGKRGKVINFITERDETLALALRQAIEEKRPLDYLFSRNRNFGRKVKEIKQSEEAADIAST
ncbi:uncharacterized protein LOC130613831 [Hydractinia symbiolongicarpus]|uniref:uncharacterized protein LOC130613831 n=1 Tax=Hydractinia symbiolongicarpus TaxID=13093 RepID=UPI00254AE9BA|nr:uncharacterized protein LOC130613831 [Hydractinia symbiolongicarpus]